MSQSDWTFTSLGIALMAAGLPLLIVGVGRKLPSKKAIGISR